VKDDVRCMKETLKVDGKNKVSNEFFDFHEKVNTILEEQEEIFATHMAAIKVSNCCYCRLAEKYELFLSGRREVTNTRERVDIESARNRIY